MKIITVEEHYNSVKATEKIKKIYEAHGTEEERGSIGRTTGVAGADGVTELRPHKILCKRQTVTV